MRESKVLKKLRNDDWVLVTNCSFCPTFQMAEMVGAIGFDCIWIDMEHRPFDYKDSFQLIQGARMRNMDSMVRIRKDSYASYFRVLEDGASGIMVPHCKSPEEAEWAVRNSKYSPEGLRGMDGVGVDADYTLMDSEEYVKRANEETFICVQIEDKEAVDCIDEIAAVKGLDIIFVGPGDLSQSYGPENVDSVIEKVSIAADNNGKWWGLPVASVDKAKYYLDMGARFIAAGADLIILMEGFKKIKEDFAKLKV